MKKEKKEEGGGNEEEEEREAKGRRWRSEGVNRGK